MTPASAGVMANDCAISVSSPIGMNSEVLKTNADRVRPINGRTYFKRIGGKKLVPLKNSKTLHHSSTFPARMSREKVVLSYDLCRKLSRTPFLSRSPTKKPHTKIRQKRLCMNA